MGEASSTLMFGLGVTRSGSTWLYRYLEEHPQCALPSVKELHYFSTLDFGGQDRQIRRLDGMTKRAQAQLLRVDFDKTQSVLARLEDVSGLRRLISGPEDGDAYLHYLKESRHGNLHGDITPAYALLSEERLSMMSKMAERTRFVIFLRDPVSRIWSNVLQTARLKAKRREKKPSTELVGQIAQNLFISWSKGREKSLDIRCDYEGMLTRLSRAVPEDDVFVGFFENLFSDETIHKLCRFLGISYKPADFGRRRNASDKIHMTDAQRKMAQIRLAPQYDFVDSYMGGALPTRWFQNRSAFAEGTRG